MPNPRNTYLSRVFDLSSDEKPSLSVPRMFRITYPDGKQVHMLGTTHVLPISFLSKQEILAIDQCSFFIGEEADFDWARREIIAQDQKRFLREEKDTWYDEINPVVLRAMTCLWEEVIAKMILGACPDIKSFNREAVIEYLGFCVYDLIEATPEIREKLMAAPEGMDAELEQHVFPERSFAFDGFLERRLRNYSTDNLPKNYLETNRLSQEDKMLYYLLAAKKLTSFTFPEGFDLSSISDEAPSLEEFEEILIKEEVTNVFLNEVCSNTISDILEDEEEDAEEDLCDIRKCNVKWSSQLHSMICAEDGIGLVGVGRGHLFGEYGMLTLLHRDHGCKVETVSPSGWIPWSNMYMQYLDSYRMLRREILEGPIATLPLYQGFQSGAGISTAPIVIDSRLQEVLFPAAADEADGAAKAYAPKISHRK